MTVFYEILSAAGYASICGVVLCMVSYLTVGTSAIRFPAGAVVAACFLEPWWAAFFAGLFAHIVCVFALHFCLKLKSPKMLASVALVAFACFTAGLHLSIYNSVGEVIQIVERDRDTAWARIHSGSAAGAFVATKYRDCITPVSMPVIPARGSAPAYTRRTDPSICASTVITLAGQFSGPEFAGQVSKVIQDLPSTLALSRESEIAISKLTTTKS